jgi:cyclic pyranopterin phosphate synthase
VVDLSRGAQFIRNVGLLERVLAGIAAAKTAGFHPVKLNTVVKRGVNDTGIVDIVRYARQRGHIARFIEYMDVGNTKGWRHEDVVPAAEVVERIDAEFPLEPIQPAYTGEVAERYRFRDGAGEVGVIASVTRPFCRTCVRARLSTDGQLYTCLFANKGHDLRAALRSGMPAQALNDLIGSIWGVRTDRYSEERSMQSAPIHKIEMSYIGG